MSTKTLDFTAANGVPFRAVLILSEEDYTFPLGEYREPLVEFYDQRYPHTEHGQFVSRYYYSTLYGHTGGLCLYGGVPAWEVDERSMDRVIAFIDVEVSAAGQWHIVAEALYNAL